MAAFKQILDIFRRCGFVFTPHKTRLPSRIQSLLGFVLNTRSMKIEAMPIKHQYVLKMAAEFQGSLPLKEVAKRVGIYLSMTPCLNINPAVFLSSCFAALLDNVDPTDASSYNNLITITQAMKQEVDFLAQNYVIFSGKDIRPKAIGDFVSSEDISHLQKAGTKFIASDAGKDGVCVADLQDHSKVITHEFDSSHKTWSSSLRELQGLYLAVTTPGFLKPSEHYVFLTDSENLVRWMKSGTSRESIAKFLRTIQLTLWEHDISIQVVWRSRMSKEIQFVDESMRLDHQDFSLRRRDIQFIKRRALRPFSIDIYGHNLRRVTKLFYSRVPMANSLGCMGQHQPWMVGRNPYPFIFPPKSLFLETAMRILHDQDLQGVLVYLGSRTETFHKVLMDDTGHFLPFVSKVIVRYVKLSHRTHPYQTSTFINSWHLLFIIYIDKNQSQPIPGRRCVKPYGACKKQVGAYKCKGNKRISFKRREYPDNDF